MCDSTTRLANEVIGDVEAFLAHESKSNVPWSEATSFSTRIRRNIRLAEAPSFGKSIFDYAPTSNGAADYQQLAEELIATSHSPFAEQRPRPQAESEAIENKPNRGGRREITVRVRQKKRTTPSAVCDPFYLVWLPGSARCAH